MFRNNLKKLGALVSVLTISSLLATTAFAYGGGGSAGGGGGGGGSGSSGGVAKLSSLSSGSTQTVTKTAQVAKDGVVHKPTVIKSSSNDIALSVPRDTKVTDKKGKTYTGTISTAKVVLEGGLPKAVPSDIDVKRAFTIKTEGGVNFSQNVSITVPLTGDVNPDKAQVWYYDTSSGTWKVAGDGGVVSADGASITVTVDHLTYFVVGEAGAAKSGGGAVDGFKDIQTHWAKDFIQELSDAGVVSGKSAGVFQPNGYLTRAEAAKIVLGALGYTVSEGAAGFGDTGSHWSSSIVGTAKQLGVVNGYPDGTFRPDNFISRAEVLTMLLNAKGVATSSSKKANFPDLDQGAWYANAVNFAVEKGIMSGYQDGTVGPGNNITRGEMAKLSIMTRGL